MDGFAVVASIFEPLRVEPSQFELTTYCDVKQQQVFTSVFDNLYFPNIKVDVKEKGFVSFAFEQLPDLTESFVVIKQIQKIEVQACDFVLETNCVEKQEAKICCNLPALDLVGSDVTVKNKNHVKISPAKIILRFRHKSEEQKIKVTPGELIMRFRNPTDTRQASKFMRV